MIPTSRPGRRRAAPAAAALCLLAASPAAQAQPRDSGAAWQFGAVIDLASTSRELELGGRSAGLQLGHSDLTASGPVGRHLAAQLTSVVATHDGTVETGIEEAWVQTRTLPGGVVARAGRFASQVGHLNSQHPHADDFVERPLLHRALLGGHWFDDGVRVNLTLPTAQYWMVGAELFRGRKLVPEADPPRGGAGAATLVARTGGDLGRAHSWQLGLSYLHNRRTAAVEDEEEHGAAHEGEGHDQDHGHGARFGGRRTWMLDATWKWAPGGNNREQQLRLTLEAARVSGVAPHAGSGQRHDAVALSAVWRFDPHWEAGARIDQLRVSMPHEDHFESGRLRERAVMLAWKPSHMQSLRLQLSRQGGALGFESPARRSVALQYVVSLGVHGAHAF